MPNVTLRLSDEEHGLLKIAAGNARRSLQQEIKARLFPARELPVRPLTPAGLPTPSPLIEIPDMSVRRGFGSSEKRSFTPDPKGKKK